MKCYRVSGGASVRFHDLPGVGPPIVFLHGLGCASSSDYVEVAAHPALAPKRRILVDLLGAGFSDAPSDFGYRVEDHAAYVADFIAWLDTPVILFGHSFGGPIAISVASVRPTFVSRLILGEPNLDPGGGTISRSVASQTEEQFVAAGFKNLANARRADGADGWAKSLLVSDPRAIHRGAVSLVEGSDPTWRALLLELPMNKAVIFGEHSLPDPDFETLPAAGIFAEIVAGAGHDMAFENPFGLAEALERCCSD